MEWNCETQESLPFSTSAPVWGCQRQKRVAELAYLRQPGGFEGLQQQSGGHMNNGKEKESGGSPSRGAFTVGKAFAGECATRPEPVRDHDRRRGCHTGGVLAQGDAPAM